VGLSFHKASGANHTKDKFPDLILGDADGASAAPAFIEAAYKCT
jgi:N-formylglutamate amidohydrolase